jgi:hypothetical protein
MNTDHIRDEQDMVVGDNDHGDAVSKCGSCGEDEFSQELMEELWERRTDMTEMKEQIKLLRKERDEARRQVCEFEMVNIKCAHDYATYRGWDCYKKEETP